MTQHMVSTQNVLGLPPAFAGVDPTYAYAADLQELLRCLAC